MVIHKEGYKILLAAFIVLVFINLLLFYFLPDYTTLLTFSAIICTLSFLLVLQFFRSPKRTIVINDKHVVAPADGRVVVIEEVVEPEYFKDARRQISIFMSPINVHINRNPISGIIKYFKYHPGTYKVAWHPKSSIENERTTIVVQGHNNHSILIRQIAGALARRIVWYLKEGQEIKQGEELGFIKFGSRVDVFIPLNAKVSVNLGEKTLGGITVLAEFE
ncbi:MAG: phosphatidylserine decarboxylase family protein [Cytophagaceae bacterium]|nr:phosphatidylserine decarboxylase family protein [Cytophagaceae bacterium]